MLRRVLALWVPVVLWASVIFALSSIPSLGTGLGTWDLVLRKLAHAAAFGILALLVLRATRAPGVALLLTFIYAVSDEIHQSFVRGRSGRPLDVLIDTVGAAAAILGVMLIQRRQRQVEPVV
jgi:VanZ family protein